MTQLPGVVASGRRGTTVGSVRFDASGEKYSRSATGLGAVAFTRCCWVKIVVDRNAVSSILGCDNAGAGYNSLVLMSNGTALGCIRNTGDGTSAVDLTVGVWYFVADFHPVGAATTGGWYYQTEGQATLNAVASGALTTNPLVDAWTFTIGNDGFSSFLNGSIAQVRVWAAVLTQAELLAEYHATSPVRATNLWAAYSFASGPQTTDNSGNGRTLTAAGTPTLDAAGPTIS